MKDVNVTFSGGKKIEAHIAGHTVRTDQPEKDGGEGTAPSPFDLFFASLGTCAGYYALEFCNSRKLGTDGLGVHLTAERDEEKKLFTPIRIAVTLPRDFPEKYAKAILRAVESCTVKKHVAGAPEFVVEIA